MSCGKVNKQIIDSAIAKGVFDTARRLEFLGITALRKPQSEHLLM